MIQSQKGFTLAELIVVVAIMAGTLTGMIQLFIYTSTLAELSGNITTALAEAQDKIEEIRNYDYDQIAADYANGGSVGNIFDLTLLDGKGVVYIDNTNAELLSVDVVISWQNKYNRIIGEDLNLDGVLDAGEDANSNGKLDSRIEIATMITRR